MAFNDVYYLLDSDIDKYSKKAKIKYWLVTAVIIVLLGVCMYQLLQMRRMIKEHYTAFEEDPLAFGARRFGIDGCACPTTSPSRVIFFNQTGSTTRIQQVPNNWDDGTG